MEERHVLIPVKCPQCGNIALVAFPDIVVFTVLTLWRQMRLFATCHQVAWDASASEVEKIRDHVGEQWLEAARHRLADEKIVEERPSNPAIATLFSRHPAPRLH